MDSGTWVALITAIIAASVALIGYVLTQLANRRERKSKVYAEALTVLREYQELPYRVRRRPSADSATRSALGDEISAVLARLGFYRSWLEIESDVVGPAFRDLIEQARRLGAKYRNTAWAEQLISSDAELASLKYEYDIGPEMELCLEAMRRELSSWGFIHRKPLKASLERQRQIRNQEKVDS